MCYWHDKVIMYGIGLGRICQERHGIVECIGTPPKDASRRIVWVHRLGCILFTFRAG